VDSRARGVGRATGVADRPREAVAADGGVTVGGRRP